MKPKFTRHIYRKLAAVITLFFVFAAFTACSVVESAPSAGTKTGKASRKERDVKIYPDIVKRVMHIKSVEEQQVDFFVFDTEGTLKLHFKMNEGEHKKISGLDRGAYVYQVFKGDEMTESGKITIK